MPLHSVESDRKLQLLEAMGIPVWQPRPALQSELTHRLDSDEIEPTVEATGAGGGALTRTPENAVLSDLRGLDWRQLAQRVAQCQECQLCKTRQQTVFGDGNQLAKWLVVGEAPGAEEDRQGKPFVGRAGKLLDNMLQAIGLSRETAYIANIVKCRPPANRDPHVDERQQCLGFLHRQIELLEPRIILVLGRVAAHTLLETEEPIGRLRGREFNYGAAAIPVVVTYHPAYLLRSPLEKRKVWDDLVYATQRYTDTLT